MLNEELKRQYTQIKTKFFLSKLVTAIENIRPNFSGQGGSKIKVDFSETLLFWGF